MKHKLVYFGDGDTSSVPHERKQSVCRKYDIYEDTVQLSIRTVGWGWVIGEKDSND